MEEWATKTEVKKENSFSKTDLGSLKSFLQTRKAFPIAVVGLVLTAVLATLQFIYLIYLIFPSIESMQAYVFLATTINELALNFDLITLVFVCYLVVSILRIKQKHTKVFLIVGLLFFYVSKIVKFVYRNEFNEQADLTICISTLSFYVTVACFFIKVIKKFNKISKGKKVSKPQQKILLCMQKAEVVEKNGDKKFLMMTDAFVFAGEIDKLNALVEEYDQKYADTEFSFLPKEWPDLKMLVLYNAQIVEGEKGQKELKARLNSLYKQRNYKEIRQIQNEYNEKIDEYKRQIAIEYGNENFVVENEGKSKFDGKLFQYLGVEILCSLITIFTFGIAYPAALCLKEKWLKKHTLVDGVRLSFDGKGIQLFGSWIKWFLLSIITFGIYALWLPIKIENWKAKHTHLNGGVSQNGGCFDGGLLALIGISALCVLISVVTFGIGLPAAICLRERWIKKHTIVDGVRLSFDGRGIQLFGNWIKWLLLTIITFGIFALWVPIKIEGWTAKHTHMNKQEK